MPNTFELIASYTATGSVSSIDFTSIPSTYTDLVLKLSTRQSRSEVASNIGIQFNGSSSNLSSRYLIGTGSAAASSTFGSTILFGNSTAATATASTFANSEVYIPNYAGSTNKSVSADSVTENNASNANAILSAGLWSQTAAITSISIVSLSSDNFVQYSTAYLYGVKNA
jgi:hypothetical protein